MAKLKDKGKIHDTLTGYDFRVDEPLRPLKAMRTKCKECCGSNPEVRECQIFDCSLYPYRMGKGNRKRNMTDEQKQEVAERFRKHRESGRP